MKKEFKALLEDLNNKNEDYELYPTTKEMIETICKYHKEIKGWCVSFGDVLDIGCGTCNFKKYSTLEIKKYFVMEKSKTLIDMLDEKSLVVGTDFKENTLIDKPVSVIFCNPPYSEYVDWTCKIIQEAVADDIYLIIPERWKNNEKIDITLDKVFAKKNSKEARVTVVGNFDFLDAERQARAKVDIIHINKRYCHKAGFDIFFDEVFEMNDENKKLKEAEKEEKIKSELISGKNKIEVLCNGYRAAQDELFHSIKTISSIDSEILDKVGVNKEKVKASLKFAFENLKNKYWGYAMECLDEVTSRLTSTSRKNLMSEFSHLKNVDFTPENIYSLIVWVAKNSHKFYKKQMIDFFIALSEEKNVKNYKSNQRAFCQDHWRFASGEGMKNSHYTLDYRIVCTKYALPGESGYSYSNKEVNEVFKNKISDIITVANNLGFTPGKIDLPEDYGKLGKVYMSDNKNVLFEYRCYWNDNVHVKFNKEFIKCLNVAVGKELGWLREKQDVGKEFHESMSEGSEKYFDFKLELPNLTKLIGNN